MIRAFIIRPLGAKARVNFDAVHGELIQPVLPQASAAGSTSTDIMVHGNITQDMFRLLVRADPVVADVSIHDAKASYERRQDYSDKSDVEVRKVVLTRRGRKEALQWTLSSRI
jgi:hypothetical protein